MIIILWELLYRWIVSIQIVNGISFSQMKTPWAKHHQIRISKTHYGWDVKVKRIKITTDISFAYSAASSVSWCLNQFSFCHFEFLAWKWVCEWHDFNNVKGKTNECNYNISSTSGEMSSFWTLKHLCRPNASSDADGEKIKIRWWIFPGSIWFARLLAFLFSSTFWIVERLAAFLESEFSIFAGFVFNWRPETEKKKKCCN